MLGISERVLRYKVSKAGIKKISDPGADIRALKVYLSKYCCTAVLYKASWFPLLLE